MSYDIFVFPEYSKIEGLIHVFYFVFDGSTKSYHSFIETLCISEFLNNVSRSAVIGEHIKW
jgi:hypothetical protein